MNANTDELGINNKVFGAQLLTLPEIFNGRLFTIPDYQRGYAWEKEQVEDLLKDIDHLMIDGKAPLNDSVVFRHYTGTLVFSRPDFIDDGRYHVVDGQQRLTTLVIFMQMLKECLPLAAQPELSARYLRRGEIGSDCAVLSLNKDTREFFKRVVLGDGNSSSDTLTLEAHHRLLESRKLIGRWLAERLGTKVLALDICTIIETKLGFLVYAPSEVAETGIMFEVINNRGKSLSELEKVKNYLIYCSVKLTAPTLRNTIDATWSKILHCLNTAKKTSPSDEGAFLRYCVAVHFKLNKTDSQYGYDELKKLMFIDAAMKNSESKKITIEQITAFVSFLREAAVWYARLYGQLHENIEPQLIPILNQLRAQGQQASIMPIFLALVIKLKGKGNKLTLLLKLLEILNFRVYMARNMTARNDTGQGDLYSYASRYFHDELLKDTLEEAGELGNQSILNDLEDALEYQLVGFILWLSADERFKNSFALERESPNDFYRWGGLKYFLMSYEANLQPHKTISIDKILLSRQEGKSADYLSVEHIWATENRNKLGENDRSEDRFQKRRLGNFVLLELRLNIQGSNDGLGLKLPRYTNPLDDEPSTDLEQVRTMIRDAGKVFVELGQRAKRKNYYFDLYNKINSLQEKRFVDFAEKRWSIKSFLGYKHRLINAIIVNKIEVES